LSVKISNVHQEFYLVSRDFFLQILDLILKHRISVGQAFIYETSLDLEAMKLSCYSRFILQRQDLLTVSKIYFVTSRFSFCIARFNLLLQDLIYCCKIYFLTARFNQ